MKKLRRPNGNRIRMSKKKQKRILHLICAGVIGVIAVLLIIYFMLYRSVSKYPENEVLDQIYAGTVDLSGMTEAQVEETLNSKLSEALAEVITVNVDGQPVEMTLEECGITYEDVDKLAKEAVDYGKAESLWDCYWHIRRLRKEAKVFSPNIILNTEQVNALFAERAVPLTTHAQNATITRTDAGFDIEKEQQGETVDIETTQSDIEAQLNKSWDYKAFSIDATLITEEPTITEAQLSEIQDELGSFSTNAGGGTRWTNLQTGVNKLNGRVVMPGEELSVHDATAPYDEENGYVPAGSYENGQVVDSYGGGICQVSTTLYNAVLFAELEIVERYPHSMLVNYVDPSRDAAIAGDYKDLVFKNSYDTPIYIAAEIDGNNQLCFAIYGKETREEGRVVSYESETIDTEEAGVTYKENSEASLGSMNTTQVAHTGKTARLWKVVTVNGEEVSRDVINNSSYNMSDQIIEVGTASSNANATALVRQAINSQDRSKIYAAINEASALGGE